MPGLALSEITDLLHSTLPGYKTGAVNLYQTLRDYVGWRQIIGNRAFKENAVGGSDIRFQVLLETSGNASFTKPHATTSTSQSASGTQGVVPFRYAESSYVFDERELKRNMDKAKLFSLQEQRSVEAITDMAELIETAIWNGATSDDGVTPFGFNNYWLQTSATEGFNGGAPAGFAAGCAGVLDDKYQNYTDDYTAYTRDDVFTKIRRALIKTNWRPVAPGGIPDPGPGGARRSGLYCNTETLLSFQNMLEDRNSNLGPSINPYGEVMVNGAATITAVPTLDSDTTYPILGIDWSTAAVVQDEWMYRSGPTRLPHINDREHRVTWHCSYNTVMYNRRKNFKLYKSA